MDEKKLINYSAMLAFQGDKNYYQFIESDGAPSKIGKSYYHALLSAIIKNPYVFLTSQERLKSFEVSARIANYINEQKYMGTDNYKNNGKSNNWNFLKPESIFHKWNYVFDKNMNYFILSADSKWKIEIPWSLSNEIIKFCYNEPFDYFTYVFNCKHEDIWSLIDNISVKDIGSTICSVKMNTVVKSGKKFQKSGRQVANVFMNGKEKKQTNCPDIICNKVDKKSYRVYDIKVEKFIKN